MINYYYYLYESRDGHRYIIGEALTPWLMQQDLQLFDTREECADYWRQRGIEADRYA